MAGSTLYSALMWAGSWWCHQLPARSPHLWGAQLPLCWRCAGVALGACALLLWLAARKRLPPVAAGLLLSLPLPLDVLHAALTASPGDNSRRLATGLLWGFFATSAALGLISRMAARPKADAAPAGSRAARLGHLNS